MNQLSTERALRPEDDPVDPAAYEKDFVLWIEKQLELLRAKRFEQLDLDNIIEELDGMNKSLRHALASRLETVLVHLLRCQFQPEHQSGSWLVRYASSAHGLSASLRTIPALSAIFFRMPLANIWPQQTGQRLKPAFRAPRFRRRCPIQKTSCSTPNSSPDEIVPPPCPESVGRVAVDGDIDRWVPVIWDY